MKTTTVGDLLSPLPGVVQDQVMETIKSKAQETVKVTQLKQLLGEHRRELESHGVDPDYLAYALVFYVLPQVLAAQNLN